MLYASSGKPLLSHDTDENLKEIEEHAISYQSKRFSGRDFKANSQRQKPP